MVEITIEAVRDRTWAAVETGCGTSAATMAQRRTAARVVYCDPVRRTPLQLDEADARTLAAILNRATR